MVSLEEILAFTGRLVQFAELFGIFVSTVDYSAPACSYARDERITPMQLRGLADSDRRGRLAQIRRGLPPTQTH